MNFEILYVCLSVCFLKFRVIDIIICFAQLFFICHHHFHHFCNCHEVIFVVDKKPFLQLARSKKHTVKIQQFFKTKIVAAVVVVFVAYFCNDERRGIYIFFREYHAFAVVIFWLEKKLSILFFLPYFIMLKYCFTKREMPKWVCFCTKTFVAVFCTPFVMSWQH